jgi:hypothetical protein
VNVEQQASTGGAGRGGLLRLAALAAGVAVAGLALGGCPNAQQPNGDGGVVHYFCEVREQCEPGQVCTNESYCADCESSGQCRLKEECRAEPDTDVQRCALRAGWGNQCARNDECSAGHWCVQGLCRPTEVVRLCPSGTNAECLTGQRCNTVNLVCEEDLGCAESSDCSPGEVCNKGSHACVPRCTAENEVEVCVSGERCVNELCVQCVKDDDCGVGLICDAAGRCGTLNRCYQDRDCKVPLVCHIPTGACVDKPPPCVSDENCADDQRCHIGTGRCIPRDCQPDHFEPNDSRETARAVPTGKHYGLTLCLGDFDFYAFNLSRGDQLGINVDADPFAEGTFSTVVQDGSGRTLAAGRLLTSYTAAATDTYFVGISTTDDYQPYDVTFLISRGIPCDDDGWEPNDTPQSATRLNNAGEVDGAICPQDVDHFELDVPAGMGLRASLVNYSSAGGLLELCVLGGGTSLGCSDDPGTPTVTLPASQVGGTRIYVRVRGVDPRSENTYTVKVEFQ